MPIPAARDVRGNGRKVKQPEAYMAGNMERRNGSFTGLTENEAKEFHGIFVTNFIAFTVIALVAHVLVWSWRPWFG